MAKASEQVSWGFLLRVVAKAAVLFVACNLLFAALTPLEWLGRFSLYNGPFPGRLRLPYGENAAESYSLSLTNLPAMLASHVISQPKAADEFRVVVLGDSGVWGWLLPPEATLAAQMEAAALTTAGGRRVRVYNLGYPQLAVSKDLLILDAVLPLEPDLIVWLVTLESLAAEKQLEPPLVAHNPTRLRPLVARHGLRLDMAALEESDFLGRTLVAQRRPLADLVRLQLFAPAWAFTRVDQKIPPSFELRQSDFAADDTAWHGFTAAEGLPESALALDVLAAGVSVAAEVPVLIVNEPIFRSDGQNSDLRYNSFYPRWVYDAYRVRLGERAAAAGWHTLDVWDAIAPQEFTDTPVHLTPRGTEILAERVSVAVLQLANYGADK